MTEETQASEVINATEATNATEVSEVMSATPNNQSGSGDQIAPIKKHQQQPQARTISPVLERLFELYPKLFGAKFLPLKLGVFQDLLARHPDEFKKDELKVAMGQHARSTRYLQSVAAGNARYDLDGQVVEPVAPEHVHHAIMEVFKRRQSRSRQDLRPQLCLRLMEAVEASGLSGEAYAELVRVQDETINALLGDALSELKLEAAKRDALMAAFTASGRTEAEFADMYGMHPAEVTAVLARVRQDQLAAQNGQPDGVQSFAFPPISE